MTILKQLKIQFIRRSSDLLFTVVKCYNLEDASYGNIYVRNNKKTELYNFGLVIGNNYTTGYLSDCNSDRNIECDVRDIGEKIFKPCEEIPNTKVVFDQYKHDIHGTYVYEYEWTHMIKE